MKVIRSPLITHSDDEAAGSTDFTDRCTMSSNGRTLTKPVVPSDPVDAPQPEPSRKLESAKTEIDRFVKLLADVEMATKDVNIEDKELERRLEDVRRGLEDEEQAHRKGLNEIKLVFEEMISKRVVDDIQQEVEKEVEKVIEAEVDRLVDEYLKRLIPDAVVDELKAKRVLLDKKRIELQNIQSREVNSHLRIKDRNTEVQKIHPIYHPDGTVSSHFPKTLQDAFNLDIEDFKALLEEYGIVVHKRCRRESILNAFLHFCGVQYQLVQHFTNTQDLA